MMHTDQVARIPWCVQCRKSFGVTHVVTAYRGTGYTIDGESYLVPYANAGCCSADCANVYATTISVANDFDLVTIEAVKPCR